MAETSIEWVSQVAPNGVILPGFTFNPWIGCTKIGPGCQNCYAAVSTTARVFGVNWGKGQPRRLTGSENWKKPLKWNRDAQKYGFRLRVFCASLADWLDDEVPIAWLQKLLDLIVQTPNLDWLLLTKRPGNWEKRMQEITDLGDRGAGAKLARTWLSGQAPDNVWVGATAENQRMLDLRAPKLLKIPANTRFLSCEPLLEPLNFHPFLSPSFRDEVHEDAWEPDLPDVMDQISWIIAGGESGHQARVCDLDWLRSIVDQCTKAEVPVFVKQLGNQPMDKATPYAVSHKKGGNINEWPDWAKVRQTPPLKEIS